MNRIAVLLTTLSCFSVACSSGKDAEPKAPPITYQASPTPAPKAADRAPTASDVPVAEDFDEESEAAITPDNVRRELDRLEAEINTDDQP